MNQPLILYKDRQQNQFQELDSLFSRIFNPQTYSVHNAIQQLKNFGGITSVMSLLQISHRQGLSSYSDNKKRIKIFGQNVSPKGQSIIKKSISAQRDFTINLLFYILTLRLFIKLLFIRDGYTVQSIWDQIISFLLLFGMIILKAMVNLQFLEIDQSQKKYCDNQWVKIRRDGCIMQAKQKGLMVGDIIILKTQETIRVDGILLNFEDKLVVNQSHTILRQDSKQKFSILNFKLNQYNQRFDPFILSGSTISYGDAQILVCRVGQKCSFRLKNEKLSQLSAQSTPLIYNLKRVLSYVQTSSNLIAILTSTYFALYYFHQALISQTLSWFTYLFILKTYSSYIGFVCLLQKLKIMRSLQFYLQTYRYDNCFKIKNKATLQKINQVDLFLIDREAIKVVQTQRGYSIPKFEFLSYLNSHFKVKIVTSQKKEKIMEEFNLYDYNGHSIINESNFFQQTPQNLTQQRITRLKDSFFITQCSKKKLQTDLLPIFEGLQYKICYIWKFEKKDDKRNISNNILSIGFSESYPQTSFLNNAHSIQAAQQQWVQIKNTSIAQDHIHQIINKSITFCQLYNLYMFQFFNNIIIFIFLSLISMNRKYSIDFYFSFTIIVIARYIFFRMYRTITAKECMPQYQTINHRKIIKLNIFLFFYYLFVIVNLKEKINVVLFFVSNTMLRTQILLFRIDKKISIKNTIMYNLIVFIVLVGYILVRILNHHHITEELMLLQYVVGLSFLLIVYVSLT